MLQDTRSPGGLANSILLGMEMGTEVHTARPLPWTMPYWPGEKVINPTFAAAQAA